MKKLERARELFDLIKDDYQMDKCRGYHPACPNCEGQLLIGYLENYIDTLESSNEYDTEG